MASRLRRITQDWSSTHSRSPHRQLQWHTFRFGWLAICCRRWLEPDFRFGRSLAAGKQVGLIDVLELRPGSSLQQTRAPRQSRFGEHCAMAHACTQLRS